MTDRRKGYNGIFQSDVNSERRGGLASINKPLRRKTIAYTAALSLIAAFAMNANKENTEEPSEHAHSDQITQSTATADNMSPPEAI